MGQRASLYFETAQKLGGVRAKIALAVAAKIPSTEAAAADDTSELLARLDAGLDEVKVRHGLAAGPRVSMSAPHASNTLETRSGGVEESLRDRLGVVTELLTQRGLVLSSVEAACRRVTEAAATGLGVDRVSVWRCGDAPSLHCLDLYLRRTHGHSDGIVLEGPAYAPYFEALATEQAIAAHDARTDPRTMCFSESYLVPLGIASMLDVPVWVLGRMHAVLCVEHVGEPRTWSRDDETFAHALASVVGIAMERTALAQA